MSDVRKDVGIVTAYGYAVEGGYQGTEAQYTELMGSIANIAQEATDAKTAAETAQGKAEDAQEAAETAQGKAEDAQEAAERAQGLADDAKSAANDSATSASESALKAEGFAVGEQNGVEVGSDSPYYHNNAKYYSEEAGDSATQAAASAATSAAMTGLAPQFDATKAYAVGDHVLYSGTLYQFTSAHAAGAWTGTDATAVTLAPEVTNLKSQIKQIDDQLVEVTGNILPPLYAIGSRYVNNGVDTWVNNTIRMSFAKGTFISLKQNDIVSISSADISAFTGGYTTNGTSFTGIASVTDSYTVPVNGLYFFNLAKVNDAVFTQADVENGWKYLTFKRNGVSSLAETLKEVQTAVVENGEDIEGIKESIGYEIAPIKPSGFYEMPYKNTALNYLGQEITDNAQDASGYIDLKDLYDVCRVVTNKTKWALGPICYYTESQNFIRRDLPGVNYNFSVYNGETVVWYNIDKSISNARYVRFSDSNDKNFEHWVVFNGPVSTKIENCAKWRFTGKKIVNFGDSIFGQTRPPKDVSTYLAENTGATVYNCGFGGCEMSTHADSNYNPFSMCNLADAIATGTWTSQESAASASGMPEYFQETVALLKNIDFSKVEIVTISYGTNDWANSTPIDNGGNSNKTYFADALRYSIERLLTAFPNLRIFVCTPTYRFWMNAQGQFVEDSNTKVNETTNTKLTDFVAKTIEVAEQYQLPYINNYEIGMNRYNRSYYFYPTDGTHPKPEGNKLIADNISNKIY